MKNIKITPILESLKLQKIDDETYFSEQYSNYVSNSRMGLIYDWETKTITPDRFFEGFKPIYSTSLDVGNAVHGMILQPEAFNIVDSVDKPTGKMGAIVEKLFRFCIRRPATTEDIKKVAKEVDYYGGNLSDKRVEEIQTKYEDFRNAKIQHLKTRIEDGKVDLYLDPKSRETSYNCIRALENNKQIQKLLHPEPEFDGMEKPISENEQAILLDIKVEIPDTQPFILKLKAKLDNYTIDTINNTIIVNDIKTLGRIVSEMNINIEKYHYNREFAFYAFLLKLVAEKYYNVKNPIVKGNYLIVSTIPQYYTKVLPMTKKMFTEGWNEVNYLLRLIAKEVATNHKDFAEWI